jgi:type I restriction enzyme M protein
MFIRDLDEADRLRQRESRMLDLPFQSIFEGKEEYRWSVFQDKPAEVMYRLIQGQIIDGELQGVFPFIKTLHENSGSAYAKYMNDAIFKIPTPQLLQKIVTELDELYEIVDKQPGSKTDARGDLYEYIALQAFHSRHKRPVSYPAPYYPHDGRTAGSANGGPDL